MGKKVKFHGIDKPSEDPVEKKTKFEELVDDGSPGDLLEEIVKMTKKKKELENREKILRGCLFDALEAAGETELILSGLATARIITPESVQLDYDKLKEEIPDDVWKTLLTEVVSDEKLEKAVERGDIDVQVVADCSDLKVGKSHLRINIS